MAEKKIQENPLPEAEHQPVPTEKTRDMTKPADKPTAPVPTTPAEPVHAPVPSFTKNSPSDMYRRLLPAVLFLLTFVTVMTMLLIYMDTVALGAQQFRLNMSRDYELARIPQESAALVAYVRQLHLQPRAARPPPPVPQATERARVLAQICGDIRDGTFVEMLSAGPRDGTTLYLESARGWGGAAVRAAPRDYLALRGAARALHACLSPATHPREVTYQESDVSSMFVSRVLCLPLYTVLLAADAARAQYVILSSPETLAALKTVPFGNKVLRIQVLDIRTTDPMVRNLTTEFLATKNYTIAASYEDGIMYKLKDLPPPNLSIIEN